MHLYTESDLIFGKFEIYKGSCGVLLKLGMESVPGSASVFSISLHLNVYPT